MQHDRFHPGRRATLVRLVTLLFAVGFASEASAQATRPMTFVDVQEIASLGSEAISPDGRWMLYTVSKPDWKAARSSTNIHLVSLDGGVESSRAMTVAHDYNNRDPQWAPDGRFFVFQSDRPVPGTSTPRSQLYLLRPDGGEALRLTDHEDGVEEFAFSRDGRWLIFRSGRSGAEQLHRMAVADIGTGSPSAEQITRERAGISRWQVAPDSRRIYFTTPDSVDTGEKARWEHDFTVDIYHLETPLESLWALELDPIRTIRLTEDPSISVTDFSVSQDSRWIGFRGTAADRYKRTIFQSNLHTELYLLETATGHIEQLTDSEEIGKDGPYFSPDGRFIAYVSARDQTRYTRGVTDRVYLRTIDRRGDVFARLGDGFENGLGFDFWSQDGNTIYFNSVLETSRQLMALDVRSGEVRQLTSEDSPIQVSRDDDTGRILVRYTDPTSPTDLFVAPSLDAVADRSSWRQVTQVNPHLESLAMGRQEAISWTSSDGVRVGGILNYPVQYVRGQRYPLIVQIHGGPSSAVANSFSAAMQVYANAGYLVLRPNYRGSTGRGEAFNDINGNYFPQGYEDIMTGVDHLIETEVADADRLGAMGWSAGGHWSNWILVNTNRFKAISSGAGAANWISMYAQTDGQRHRQEYFGGQLPYHDFDAYWDQSPLKYIVNAETPTMIHVVKGDPRVPSPQSVELHMALRQLGVPTELFMYPGNTHGIPDPRNQLLKAVSEMAWMDHYVRGIGDKFNWRQVLDTVEESAPTQTSSATGGRR